MHCTPLTCRLSKAATRYIILILPSLSLLMRQTTRSHSCHSSPSVCDKQTSLQPTPPIAIQHTHCQELQATRWASVLLRNSIWCAAAAINMEWVAWGALGCTTMASTLSIWKACGGWGGSASANVLGPLEKSRKAAWRFLTVKHLRNSRVHTCSITAAAQPAVH